MKSINNLESHSEDVMNYGSVVNRKNTPEFDVYIGRGSIWGNPFVMGKDGTRQEVIDKYEQYLLDSPELMGKIKELKGKVLGCHCYPEACHGDVLLRYANRPPRILTILGIDPGINTTGWSVIDYDIDYGTAVIRETGIIEANVSTNRDVNTRRDFKEYGNTVSIQVYRELLQGLLRNHRPSFVTCEDAFYNPRTPNAFLSIKLCIQALREVLYLQRDKLYLTAPKLAKQITFGKGTADKNDIGKAILNLPGVSSLKDLSTLSEHECDSIAMAYTFTRAHLPNIEPHVVERHLSTDFYILVTGSRSISNYDVIRDALTKVTDRLIDTKCVTIVHGGARGVDSMVDRWYRERTPRYADDELQVKVCPADWDKHGKKAGMIRNSEMIAEVAKHQCMCLAFHDGDSPGTKHAINHALKARIPVKIWKFGCDPM